MIRTLYHGSPRIVRTPGFGGGNAGNDFGIGFYCTDSHDAASEWAIGRSRDGFVNTYKLNDTGLRMLDLGSPQYCILHWLAILLSYREFDTLTPRAYQARDYLRTAFAVDHQNYDCITGWRADNMHFAFAQSFLNGGMSYEQLRDSVRLSGLGRQTVIKSNRAFDRIIFTGYEPALRDDSFPARRSREIKAIKSVKLITGSNDFFITDLIEGEVKPYDTRLR